MRIRLALLSLIFTVVLVLPVYAQSTVLDRIVAVVNDEIILLSELNLGIKPYEDQIKASGYPLEKQRKMLFKIREDMINHLVEQKLTDKEIERLNMKAMIIQEVDGKLEKWEWGQFELME